MSAPPAGSRIEIVLMAAVADNGVIGKGGTLPWRLKSDMQRLRAATWGKPIVVGRATYLSFSKKPLPGRTNIVVSRNRDFVAPGAVVAASLDAALAAARGDAMRRGIDAIIVLGGADVYVQTIADAARLMITRVHLQPDGDTRFPAIDPNVWTEAQRTEHRAGPGDDASFTELVYVRNAADARQAAGAR